MSEHTPSGWYPDGHSNERYWDGAAWTEQVRQPAAIIEPVPSADPKKASAFSKLGAAVKNTATQRQAEKAERIQKHEEAMQAAGALATSGTFGTSIVEIYEGGYVRVASESDGTTSSGLRFTGPAGPRMPKNAPYEKLRAITISLPESDRPEPASTAPLGDALGKTVTTLFSGGKALMKASAAGMATAGIAHVVKEKSRKSFLTITTDKKIHNLTNDTSNGVYTAPNKGHEAVGLELVAVGNRVLGLPESSRQESEKATEPDSVVQVAVAARPALSSGIGARLRELAELHNDGILSDEEFASAKAKLLSDL